MSHSSVQSNDLHDRVQTQWQVIQNSCAAATTALQYFKACLRQHIRNIELDDARHRKQLKSLESARDKADHAVSTMLSEHNTLFQLAPLVRNVQHRDALEAMLHTSAVTIQPIDGMWRALQEEQERWNAQQKQFIIVPSAVNPFDIHSIASSSQTWPRFSRRPSDLVAQHDNPFEDGNLSSPSASHVATETMASSRYTDVDHSAIRDIGRVVDEINRLQMLTHTHVNEQGELLNRIVITIEQVPTCIQKGTDELEDTVKDMHSGCRCFLPFALVMCVLLLVQIVIFIWQHS